MQANLSYLSNSPAAGPPDPHPLSRVCSAVVTVNKETDIVAKHHRDGAVSRLHGAVSRLRHLSLRVQTVHLREHPFQSLLFLWRN